MQINFTMAEMNDFVDEVNDLIGLFSCTPDDIHVILKTQRKMIEYMNGCVSSFSPGNEKSS